MRDEQEKCFALQKGPLGHDRLRTWSDGCAPVYVSKTKPVSRKRGRPANPKVDNQEL